TNRAAEALEALDRARALDVRSRELALNRGHALLKLYRLAEAEAAYAEAVALAPQDPDAQRSLAQPRFMAGDPTFARALVAAGALARQGPDAQRRLAQRRFRPGDPKLARDLVAACAAYPRAIGLQVLLAEVVRNAGDLASAEVLPPDLIQRGHANALLHSALASVLLEAGRLQEAHDHACTAASLSPDSPAIIENLIMASLLLGDADDAREHIRARRLREPLEQRWIAYEALAARMVGDPLYAELYDYDRVVRVYEIAPPSGWQSIVEFNAALDEVLAARHPFARHPLDLSVRHGSQTSRSLLADEDALIRAVLAA